MANVFDMFDGQTPKTNPFDNFDESTKEVDTPVDSFGEHLTKKFQQGALQATAGMAEVGAFGTILAGGVVPDAFGGGDNLFKKANALRNHAAGMRNAAGSVGLGVGTQDEKLGAGKKYTGMVFSAIPQIAGFIANVPSGIMTSMLPAISDAGANVDANLSAKTVAANLAVDSAVNIVGALLPGGFGLKTATKAITGAGANVALGAAGDVAKQEITGLENEELAAKYDPTNIEARIADALFGAAGGVAHKGRIPDSDLKIDDILSIIDPQDAPEVQQDLSKPLDMPKNTLELSDGLPNETPEFQFPEEGLVDFNQFELAPKGEALPQTIEGMQLEPKGVQNSLELAPKGNLEEAIQNKLSELSGGRVQKELPKYLDGKGSTNIIEKTQSNLQSTLDLDPTPDIGKGLDYSLSGNPEGGAFLRDRTITDITKEKPMPSNLDLPLGQTKFGKKQAGFITLGKQTPKTLEQKAKQLNLEEFSREFVKDYPRYQDRPEIIQQVFNRLNDPVNSHKSLSDAINASSLVKGLDERIGIVSTRIGNISKPILHRALQYEYDLLGNTHKSISRVDAFLNHINKNLDPDSQRLINNLLYNNDTVGINKISALRNDPKLASEYSKVREVLDELKVGLVKSGKLTGTLDDYFPRMVKDVEGLKTFLGSEMSNKLDIALSEARQKAAKNNSNLDAIEETKVINNFLKNRSNAAAKPGFTKSRTLNDVSPDLEKFYATPTEALHSYIRSAVSEIETVKFFKNNLARSEDGTVDVDTSIGNVVDQELKAGNISGKQADELASLLKSRHGPGNRAASGFHQDFKNLANAGLLANVTSAIAQTGDLVISAYFNGLRPTLMALTAQVAGKEKVDMKDFGLTDHLSEEFVGTRNTAKALNKLFDLSQFSRIDRLGKNTLLNGAILNAERRVKTPEGLKKLREDWQGRFGDDFPQLVKDLQAGKTTELTKMMAFSQLSKVQPVSKLEMPQAYLNHPQGRILYMLKSFMLKQMDVVRNEAIQKLKTPGKRKEGVANLAKLGLFYGIAGASSSAVKDYILNGFESNDPDQSLEDKTKDFVSDIPMNALKTLGWSEYTLSKFKEGPGVGIASMVAPPYKMFDEIIVDAYKSATNDEYESKDAYTKYVPVIGKIIYYNFMEEGIKAREKQLERMRMDRERKDE